MPDHWEFVFYDKSQRPPTLSVAYDWSKYIDIQPINFLGRQNEL